MRAFVTLLNSIPFGLACFLAPLVCFLWVLFSDAWSPMLFIFLVGLMALLGMFLILCVSGFLGPFGVLGLPILYSAYVQFDFLTDCRAKFGDAYAIQFMLASVALASIPTINLGKGFEHQPAVIIFRGMLSLSFGAVAWMLSHGQISSYWQVLGLHVVSIIAAASLVALVGDGAGHHEMNLAVSDLLSGRTIYHNPSCGSFN